MRILVTGGAGYIGSHLCARLRGEGHRVVWRDNLSTGRVENIAGLRGDDLELVLTDVARSTWFDVDRHQHPRARGARARGVPLGGRDRPAAAPRGRSDPAPS